MYPTIPFNVCGHLRPSGHFDRIQPATRLCPILTRKVSLFLVKLSLSSFKLLQSTIKIKKTFENYLNISLLLNRYPLFGLTFWSGGHYRGAVLVNRVWHHYDGLWERNSRGQGLEKCTGKPATPSGFLLSHCVYIFEKILH